MARKNSLVENINRRKRAGKSRPKSRSTVSKQAYENMEQGWPSKRKASRKKGAKKSVSKKRSAKSSAAKRKSASKRRRAKG
ncbi:MAG: hypothetical protein ACJ8MR_07645 [Povalibacter sp.]